MNPILRELVAASPTVSVGIITADLMSLGSEVSILEETGVKLVHFDVMDGCFCPALTVGPLFIRAVKTLLFKDVHLMIQDPLEKVGDYVAAGADIVTVPAESGPHVHRMLRILGGLENANDPARGLVRGLGLNPGTLPEVIEPLTDEIEMVVLLAVDPGWGGQKFIDATRRKIEKAKRIIADSGREILLCIDGGITRDNIVDVVKMGADIVVTGSAVFDGKAAAENAKFMLSAVRRA